MAELILPIERREGGREEGREDEEVRK